MRCLWLMRMYPVPPDTGDLTYSFHLLSRFSAVGVRLTVLATRLTGDRARSPSDNGIEWVLVPRESDRGIGGRLAARSPFQPPYVMLRADLIPHHYAARFERRWRKAGTR